MKFNVFMKIVVILLIGYKTPSTTPYFSKLKRTSVKKEKSDSISNLIFKMFSG